MAGSSTPSSNRLSPELFRTTQLRHAFAVYVRPSSTGGPAPEGLTREPGPDLACGDRGHGSDRPHPPAPCTPGGRYPARRPDPRAKPGRTRGSEALQDAPRGAA